MKQYELGPMCPYCKVRPRVRPGYPCQDCKNKYAREHRKLKPWVYKNITLKKDHGISLNTYQEMYNNQNGLCLICTLPYEVLHVDHDHSSGKIRGLLCTQCNTGLGLFKDNIESLQRAILYVG